MYHALALIISYKIFLFYRVSYTLNSVYKFFFQYQFVTPLTSLVVVQPDSQRCKDYDDEYYYEEEKDETDLNGIKSTALEDTRKGQDDLGANNVSINGDRDSAISRGSDKSNLDEIKSEDEEETSLDSDSKKSRALSPKIYNQNELGDMKHPDDQILETIQTMSHIPLSSNSAARKSCQVSASFAWLQHPSIFFLFIYIIKFVSNFNLCITFTYRMLSLKKYVVYFKHLKNALK